MSAKPVAQQAVPHLIAREGLLQRLTHARRKRCILIQAPAGSGKTAALAALRRKLMTLGFDVAWLALTPRCDDVACFFESLLAGVGQVDARAVRDAALVGGDDAAAIEHRVIALAQGLAGGDGELVLVLDDAHQLSAPGALQALHWLLDYAPPRVHIVLATRSPFAHPLSTLIARLRQQGQVADFDFRDLRFCAEETAFFLRERLGRVDPRDALRLHELTDGWAAGLELVAADLMNSTCVPSPGLSESLRDTRALARYFAAEVFAQIASDDAEMLMRAAVVTRFCAPLCVALSEPPQPAALAALRLAQLAGRGFVIVQVEAGAHGPWYRLHPLARQALLDRLAGLPTGEREQIHVRAWRWFETNGYIDEAVGHALQAGESVAALQLVDARARDLLNAGEFEQLTALLRGLPAHLAGAGTDAGLRLVLAHIHLYSRDLDALSGDLAVLAGMRLDAGQRAQLALLHCGLALQRDDVDAAAQCLPELQDWPAQAGEYLQTERANLLAWVHMARGDFALARRILEDGSERRDGLGANLTGLCLKGLSHALEGRMADAEHLYRQALDGAEAHGASVARVANMASALLGDVLYELDELDAACALLDARVDSIEHAGIPEAMLRTAIVLASAHWVSGRRLEALAQLDRLEDYAGQHGLDRLQAHALCLRVRLQQQRGEVVAVSDALCRLDDLAARRTGMADTVSQEILRLAERAQVAVHMHRGELDAAARALRELVARSEEAGRLRPVVAMRIQLALLEQSRGCPEAATPLLIDALRLGHRLGLIRTVLDASRRVPAALSTLLAQQGLDPVLHYYVQRLLSMAARVRVLSQPAADPARRAAPLEPLKERELEILGLLAHALPNKKIARILGLSPDTVKWHLKNIYAKLGVSARDAAVARARDYGL